MPKLFSFLLILSMVLLVAVTGSPSQVHAKGSTNKTPGKFTIGFIKDRTLVEGCGCSFSLPNEMRKKSPPIIFGSNIDDVNKGWMNIDGRDVELSVIKITYPKGRQRVGSQSTQSYEGLGIKVSAVLIATRVCARNDEQCESTDYTGTFTVSKGRVKQTLKLQGSCGC